MPTTLNSLLLEKCTAHNIPSPNKNITAGKFIRWGKNNRYSAIALGNEGIYINDFVSGEEITAFFKDYSSLNKNQLKQRYKNIAEATRKEEEERESEYNQAAERAEKLWDSLNKNGESDYLKSKKAIAYNIRYGKGYIAIPLNNISGKITSLQRIYDDKSRPEYLINQNRNKDFLKGGKVGGSFHTIGIIDECTELFICEGYATGSTIHQATEKPVIIAFNAGNIEPVITNIKSRYPKLQLTIVADNDCWKDENSNPGKEIALAAASYHGCKLVIPSFSDSIIIYKPTDFNDIHCLEGLEIVKKQLSTSSAPAKLDEKLILERLAGLSYLDYDRIRKQEAEKLEVSVSVLDREIKRIQKANETITVAESSLFPNDEAWEDEVHLASLLDELLSLINRFAVLPKFADTTLALWITFTWCIDSMNTAPILAISSPEKQCGKTTLLSLVSKLVLRPITSANLTPAVLFRFIEKYKPTMVIDEADTFIHQSDDLRGILNSGHTRSSAYVLRVDGEELEPKSFSTWGAKAIALIGKLPETLHDRSIVVKLRRKLPHEKTEKLRNAELDLFKNLRSKLKRFSEDNLESLKLANPALPENISDRATDNWEPLLAIAELANEEWQLKALEAAIALSYNPNNHNASIELLEDINNIFSIRQISKISSTDLLGALCADTEKPWVAYNKGYPIKLYQIARILRKYDIQSKNLRFSHGIFKGYEFSQFQDAFKRYLSTLDLPATTLQGHEYIASSVAHDNFTASATQKMAQHNESSGVAENIYTYSEEPHDDEVTEEIFLARSKVSLAAMQLATNEIAMFKVT